MIKKYIKILILLSLTPLIASAAYLDALPSFADYLHLSRSKDPAEHGWLPEVTGLPNKDQVAHLNQRMLNVISKDTDKKCTSIDVHLRMMIFQHFLIYQHMVNTQNVYFDDKTAHQWAHVLAMILKESSGDSTNITDMSGHSVSTDNSKTNLQQWRAIFNLTKQSHVELNDQTNFGLTQMSTDRLFDAFCLTKDQKYDTAFLEGREGASTPGKVVLNTAIAIRRLIWFYQEFAQGRIVESEGRLRQQDISNPKFSARYKKGLDMAILYCGTGFMFRGGALTDGAKKTSKLRNAMASIAYCKLGNPQEGYGTEEVDEKCFAEWVTLCPALNIDIATLTPLRYFATRNEKPVCEDTFKQLINKKPGEKPWFGTSISMLLSTILLGIEISGFWY